jgi:hypothetical protein
VRSTIAAYVFYIVNPYLFPREYSVVLKEIYSNQAYGAILNPYGTISYLIALANLASLVGTMLYSRVSRTVLIWLYVIFIFTSPLDGIMIAGPFDSTLGLLVTTGTVVTIVLSFTSEAHKFE